MVSLVVMPGVAAGQPSDFAVGAGNDGVGHFNLSAHQAGISAIGQMSYRTSSQVIRADVSCLNVQGDLAFILGIIDQGRSIGVPAGADSVVFEVRDAPGADAFAIFFASSALGCPLAPFPGTPIVHGNIVVRDRTP
jgi:hypothetical protein